MTLGRCSPKKKFESAFELMVKMPAASKMRAYEVSISSRCASWPMARNIGPITSANGINTTSQ